LDTAECEGEMNLVRNTLLELWMKLSMIIEKIENPQDTVQFLNVLFRYGPIRSLRCNILSYFKIKTVICINQCAICK